MAPAPVVAPPFARPAAPLDKAARRAARKEEEESGARIAALFGYTAESNPFGDPNVTQLFTWKKKQERDVALGKSSGLPSKEESLRKREELVSEVERAKERRAAREKAREEMERLKAEENRLRDSELHLGWEKQEAEFLQRQVALRSLLRIRECREHPLDALCRNIILIRAICNENKEARGERVEQGVQLEDPVNYISRLKVKELEEALEEASEMQDLDIMEVEGGRGNGEKSCPTSCSPSSLLAWWKSLVFTIRDSLGKARDREKALARGVNRATLDAVEAQIEAQFSSKTLTDLNGMEKEVEMMLGGGGEGRGNKRG